MTKLYCKIDRDIFGEKTSEDEAKKIMDIMKRINQQCPHCGNLDTKEILSFPQTQLSNIILKEFLESTTYHCPKCTARFVVGKVLIY
jgi:predicted nucleic-acid-binding Zn-ribbon protein